MSLISFQTSRSAEMGELEKWKINKIANKRAGNFNENSIAQK